MQLSKRSSLKQEVKKSDEKSKDDNSQGKKKIDETNKSEKRESQDVSKKENEGKVSEKDLGNKVEISWTDKLDAHLRIMIEGLIDSLSIHRTFPVLVNNPAALRTVLLILVASGVLVLGSVFVFNQGITPLISLISEGSFDLKQQSQYDLIIWILYQVLWLIPICGLCYACCFTWYVDLGEAIQPIFSEQLKNAQNKQAFKTIEFMIYGTLAWVFVFVQMQLLVSYIPLLISSFESMLITVIDHAPASNSLFGLFGSVFKILIIAIFESLSNLIHIFGLLFMSVLYAWYGFDPKWISLGINPDERFSIMEKHIAYFIGFGLPYVLLNRTSSFFVGFGGYLMAFPFCIILGSVSDYTIPYKQHKDILSPTDDSYYRIFKLAQVWTLNCLKYLGKDIKKATKPKAKAQ